MGKIMLHGDCLIGRASELHQLFLHHLDVSGEDVEIDMSGTGRCDVSFFQLLCAATRSFHQKNKKIKLLTPLPEALVAQFKKSGWEAVCTACPHAGCLFKEALEHSGKEASNQ